MVDGKQCFKCAEYKTGFPPNGPDSVGGNRVHKVCTGCHAPISCHKCHPRFSARVVGR